MSLHGGSPTLWTANQYITGHLHYPLEEVGVVSRLCSIISYLQVVWRAFQSGAELLEHLGTLNSAQNGHFMHFSNSCQFGLAIAGGILYSGNFYKVQIFAFFTNLNLQNLFPLTFCHLDYLAKLLLCCFPYKYFHSPQETFINRRQSHSSTLGRFEYHLCIFCVGWLTPTPLC